MGAYRGVRQSVSVDGEAITYTSSLGGIHPATLSGGFFEGWMSAPTPEEHLRVLQAANHVVVARHGHRVLGFVNALSDSDGRSRPTYPYWRFFLTTGDEASAASSCAGSWRRSGLCT